MSAHRVRWVVPTIIVLVAVAFAAGAGGAGSVQAGADGCKQVSGHIILQQVSGPECTSPLGLCAQGVIKGGIKGTVFVAVTSFMPSADTPTTGVMFSTGDAVFYTDRGNLMTKDASTIATAGGNEFAEVDTVVGGTGMYEGAWGTILAVGSNTGTGASGTYTGKICTP